MSSLDILTRMDPDIGGMCTTVTSPDRHRGDRSLAFPHILATNTIPNRLHCTAKVNPEL